MGLALIFMILGYAFAAVALVFFILVVVQAFKMDTTQGILTLCVPFYILYFGFAKMQHPKKNLFMFGYLGCIAMYIVCFVIMGVFAATAASDLTNMYGTGMPGMTGYPGMPMTGMPMTGFPMTGFPMTAQ